MQVQHAGQLGPSIPAYATSVLRAAQRLTASRTGQIVLLMLAGRLFMSAIGFVANAAFPLYQPEHFTFFEQGHRFWDTFARFDSGWYLTIAKDGYQYVEAQQNSLAFFPLYPMLMRAGGWVLGGDKHHFFLSGLTISWISAAWAMVLLYRLALLHLDEGGAVRSALYAAVFPFAFFYGRVYTEGLFLLLTVAAIYSFRTNRWWIGGLCGALAAATRVNGVLLFAPLLILGWQQTRGNPAQRGRMLAAALLVPASLCLYSLYVYWLAGSPLEWVESIERWDYHPADERPWIVLIDLARQLVRRPYEFIATEPNGVYDTLNGVTAWAFVAAIPFVWWRLGAAYGVLMLLNLWLPLSTGQFEGLGRYCAVLFPFFIWLASFRAPILREAIVITSVSLYVICLSLFVTLRPLF